MCILPITQYYINEILIMSNTNTIFVSGFTLGMHEEDQVVILGLTDGIISESQTTYNFALPKTVFRNLLDHLTDLSDGLAIDTDASEKDPED